MAIALGSAKIPSTRVPMRELGATGTVNMGGFLLSTDLNSLWSSLPQRIKIIEEMRSMDSKVKASLLACKLPIIASKWLVRAPENPTALEEEQADFAEENLNGMTNPWVEQVEQILTYLDFGFSVFEKVYRIGPDGRFWWKKWARSHQTTIQKWNTASDSGLDSVEQFAFRDGKYQTIPLSIRRLLIFTNEKEAGNWEGRSILRAAYRPYIYKDRLLRIDGIAHERHGVGIPKIHTPPGAMDSEIDIVERIGEDLRAHEKAYIVEPEGYQVEFMGMSTQPRDPILSVKFHNNEIASSMLASFLNLDSAGGGGSYALASVTSEFFVSSLNKHTKYISGIINRHAVRELIDVNWGEQKRYPEVQAVPVQGIDMQKMSQALFQLRQGGMVVNDERTIQHMHEIMGLPNPDPERLEELMGAITQGVQTAGTQPTEQPAKNGNSGDEEPDGEDTEDDPVPKAIRNAIDLQIQSLAKIPKDGPMRFQPPLEGTLARAMTMTAKDPNAERIQQAAREFSRRLSQAAERGFVLGGAKEAEKMARNESIRSWSLLDDAITTNRSTAEV